MQFEVIWHTDSWREAKWPLLVGEHKITIVIWKIFKANFSMVSTAASSRSLGREEGEEENRGTCSALLPPPGQAAVGFLGFVDSLGAELLW